MIYGDEYYVEAAPGFDLDLVSETELRKLFQQGKWISRFHSAPNGSFTHDRTDPVIGDSLCYKVDEDSLIEINNSFQRKPVIMHNRIADLISFQFVSTVKRSEYLGGSRNVHDLGPAIIVSAVSKPETSYRVPTINEPIRHVMVHTTLSNLMNRIGESKAEYPTWLQEILDGEFDQPRQRVLFLENVHRDLTWSCFHLPVSGALLHHWMEAKFHELLCVGLQVLKNTQTVTKQNPVTLPYPREEKIRRATTILNREYVNPPSLPAMARHLGISETQLKSGFKSMNDTTVLQYCINKRIDAAKLLLNENRHSISEISDIVGYQDHSAFSRAFRRHAGCSPRQWRQSSNTQSSAER